MDQDLEDHREQRQQRPKTVQEGGDLGPRRSLRVEDALARAVEADVGVRIGDADVDGDGVVGLVDAAKVVDGCGICDARDAACMEVRNFGDRGVRVRLAQRFGGLLVV